MTNISGIEHVLLFFFVLKERNGFYADAEVSDWHFSDSSVFTFTLVPVVPQGFFKIESKAIL